MRSIKRYGSALLLVVSPFLWAHTGEEHKGISLLPKGDPNAPVAVDARPHADEAKARNYFTDLPLKTQDGQTVRFYSDVLRGRVVLVNFIYTNCENSCPIATQQLSAVKQKLGDRFGKEVFFVSISTDPDRDTPEAMKEFAEKQGAVHPGWIFLTGEKEYVNKIITRLGQYSPVPEEHSSLLLAGNVQTRHWLKLRPNSPLPAMVYKLQQLADESQALN